MASASASALTSGSFVKNLVISRDAPCRFLDVAAWLVLQGGNELLLCPLVRPVGEVNSLLSADTLTILRHRETKLSYVPGVS